MNASGIDITILEHDDLVLSTTGGTREPGLHLTDLLKKEMFRRDKKLNPDNPMDMMTLECGHTWEEIVAHALQRREEKGGKKAGYRPEPFQFDGIWMSPDWVNPDNPDFPMEEWKATKASRRNNMLHTPDPRHWYWIPQFMGYAKGIEEVLGIPVPGCLVRAWYINGDYTYGAEKLDHTMLRDYVPYAVRFTQRAKDDNWQWLKSLGKRDGLIKEEPTWEDPEQAQPRKTRSVSAVRPPSKRKVLVFPTGKKP